MTISSLVSFISAVLNDADRSNVPALCDQPAAEVELPVTVLGFVPWAVRLSLARPDEVDHLVPARGEQLRDQAPVAARPERLGAHEAGSRLGKSVPERALPGVRAHARGVAAKRSDPDA